MLFGFTNMFLANVFASTMKQNNQKPHNFVTLDQEAQLAQTNSSIPAYAKRFSQDFRVCALTDEGWIIQNSLS